MLTTKQAIGIFFFAVLTYAVCKGGTASWYGEEHRGMPMANGQPFDPEAMTCALWKWPLGTKVHVYYKGRSVDVLVTDRGPAKRLHRQIDLSRAAFERLAPLRLGLIEVTIRQVK